MCFRICAPAYIEPASAFALSCDSLSFRSTCCARVRVRMLVHVRTYRAVVTAISHARVRPRRGVLLRGVMPVRGVRGALLDLPPAAKGLLL